MTLLVLHPGTQSTVQDLGRPGYGAIGVAPSGAMDPWALRLANLLVGSAEGAAAIEFALAGPTIAFEHDAVVALTGSRFDAALLRSVTGSAFERDVDTRDVPFAESFDVRAGETLRVGKTLEGTRGYLAIRGGIDVPEVLGSRSTQVSAGIGGRLLTQGDSVAIFEASPAPVRRARDPLTFYRPEQTLRAIPGPQSRPFTPDGIARFFSTPYVVSPRFDRSGVRLEGVAIALDRTSDIDPEGVATGAVQVPADGQPILLCNDRPATGGYAKVATVIGADMCLVAHAKPGDTVRFVRTTPEEARAAWRERENALRASVEDIR